MALMTNTQYARHRNVTVAYIGQLIKKGKIPESALVPNSSGKPLIDSVKADAALDKNLSSRNRKKVKTTNKKDSLSIQDKCEFLKKLGIKDLYSRPEAETIDANYKALQRKFDYEKDIGKWILADKAEKVAFAGGQQIKEQCLAIADRCAPLVAAESDQFECKQILLKEINYILEGLSSALQIPK